MEEAYDARGGYRLLAGESRATLCGRRVFDRRHTYESRATSGAEAAARSFKIARLWSSAGRSLRTDRGGSPGRSDFHHRISNRPLAAIQAESSRSAIRRSV